MAKGDMPNASVGIGYQPSPTGTFGGMAGGQTPGRIGTAMPPNAMGTMGGSSFSPTGNTGMMPGQGSVGPSPQVLQMLLGRMFGGGGLNPGNSMPQGGGFGGFFGHMGQGLQNLGRMQGSVMGQPPPSMGNNQVGPRFTGGSTYNRPEKQ